MTIRTSMIVLCHGCRKSTGASGDGDVELYALAIHLLGQLPRPNRATIPMRLNKRMSTSSA